MPYPESDGHVNLAYVHADAEDAARARVEELNEVLTGRSAIVAAITYSPMPSEREAIPLSGGRLSEGSDGGDESDGGDVADMIVDSRM